MYVSFTTQSCFAVEAGVIFFGCGGEAPDSFAGEERRCVFFVLKVPFDAVETRCIALEAESLGSVTHLRVCWLSFRRTSMGVRRFVCIRGKAGHLLIFYLSKNSTQPSKSTSKLASVH